MTQLTLQFEEEIWKDIPGYEGFYQASTFGRIKSLDRIRVDKRGIAYKRKGTVLSGCISRYYYMVRIYNINIKKYITIHKLIAMTFLNHTPCGHNEVINHIDGNKLNNKLTNLEICTMRENILHSFKMGLSKISQKQINDFRERNIRINSKKVIDITSGIIYDSITNAAKEFNVNISTLSSKLHNQNKNNTNFRYYEEFS